MSDDPDSPDDRPRRSWEKRPGGRDRDRDERGDRDDRDERDDRDYRDDDYEEDDRPRRRRRRRPPPNDPALKMIVPLNTSALAIIAGYLGLISVLCFPAPFALLFGILALRHLKKNPDLDGKGRAIFGIVMGALFTIPLVLGLIGFVIGQIQGK